MSKGLLALQTKLCLAFSLAFFCHPSAVAQTPVLDSLQRVVRSGDYPAAIKGYESYLSTDPTSLEGHLGLGQALTLNEEYDRAVKEYGEYILKPKVPVEHLRHYAKCMLFVGRFGDAMGVCQEVLRQKPFDPEAEKYMVLADSLDKLFTSDLSYDLLLLPFNTPESESAPSLYQGNLGMSRSVHEGLGVMAYTTEIHRRADKYSYFRPAPVWMAKNPTGWDQGAFAFNAATHTVAVTRRPAVSDLPRLWPDSAAPLSIVFCEVDPDRVWDNEVPFAQNSNQYSNAFPCFAIGGKYLLFASDRPGGFGGFDLYICQRDGRGWSQAMNLGPSINSKGNEVYPFVHADGSLYFSTDYYKASHDFDIHEAQLKIDGSLHQFFSESGSSPFAAHAPLAFPINSSFDDYGYVMEENRRHGFFCSNRTGGVGSDDIYALNIREVEAECTTVQPDGLCFDFFDANNLASGPTYAYQYEWNFGDGTSAFTEKAHHCYSEGGSYLVSLSIFDPASGKPVTNIEGMVNAQRVSQAKATGPTQLKVGEKGTFSGVESYLLNRRIVKYQWDLGDGVFQSGNQISHAYRSPGVYTVRLRVAGLGSDLKDFEGKCTTIEVEVTE
jgi:tetratricopeptide (TPR) repeat protein